MKTNSAQQQDHSSDEEEAGQTHTIATNLSVFQRRPLIQDKNEKVDTETFEKVKTLLSCPICLDLFNEPVIVKGCQHRFCKECIEKHIRNNKQKQCPFCRKNITTKRALLQDTKTSLIIEQIFKDLNKYRDYENRQMDNDFKQLYNIERQDSKEITKLKKQPSQSSKKQASASSVQSGIVCQGKESPKKKIKKEDSFVNNINNSNNKINNTSSSQKNKPNNDTAQHKILDQMENDAQKYHQEKSSEEDIHKVLQELGEGEDYDFDLLITVELKVLPTDYITKQVEYNMVRSSDQLLISDMQKTLASKLNLRPDKYSQFFNMWVQENKNFKKVASTDTLHVLNEKYWNYHQDMKIYDIEEAYNEILDKSKWPMHTKRVLYYSFDYNKIKHS